MSRESAQRLANIGLALCDGRDDGSSALSLNAFRVMNLNRLAEHDLTQRAWLAHTASHTDIRANFSDRDSPAVGGCSCSNQPYWVRNISTILLRCFGQGDREC